MRHAARVCSFVLIAAMCLFVTGQAAWATPSGLNNIPTTDIVPTKTLVVQSWTNLTNNGHPEQFLGFKTGLFKNLEVGVDWKVHGVAHGHAEFQAKYAFDLYKDVWKGVVGVANLTDNRQHNGYFFPYVATSVDVKWFRLHFGYAPQPHNEAFFAGIDRTFPFLNRNLQLKADAIHYDDKEDVLFSVGFLYDLNPLEEGPAPSCPLLKVVSDIAKNIVIEGWVSLPSGGETEVFTLKMNYVIKF